MRVLITNDDGYTSDGLRALAHAFLRNGHEVIVVAPDRNYSAVSHSLTTFNPLVLNQRLSDGNLFETYAVAGTPADCGKLALKQILKERRPDLVVSGLNLGANLGMHVFYSGTIAGAFEGTLCRIPSVAVSVAGTAHLEDLSRLAVRLIEKLLRQTPAATWSERLLLYNINLPGLPVSDVRGVKVVPLSRSADEEWFELKTPAPFHLQYWEPRRTNYRHNHNTGGDAADDVSAVRNGYVAVTPLQFDLNCADEIQRLASQELTLDL